MTGKEFSPERDIPSLAGKAKKSSSPSQCTLPSHIFFTGRSIPRANELTTLLPNTPLTFLKCDLASLSSVSAAAKAFLASSSQLDILICNAGIKDAPPGLIKDGYKIHFGTNHLSHALLVKLLLPTMLQTIEEKGKDAVGRIIFLTSIGFKNHPKGGIQSQTLKTTQNGPRWQFFRYGQSKLANILYASQLARCYPSILTVSVHPGVVNTTLVSGLSMGLKALVYLMNLGKVKTPKEGAWNQLWAATAKREGIENGEYYELVGRKGEHARRAGMKSWWGGCGSGRRGS
ncbi:MAG: hypothetical protein M1836_003550 [Candelina mexicana]|nr:MAG: hypothetical protein M1836_003550 [Candelina mexicana]